MRPDLQSPVVIPESRFKRWIPWLGLIVAVAAAYFAFTWAIGAVIHSRAVVQVPDLNGKSVADALTLLSQSKLGMIKEGEQFDKRYPAGTIVRQSPEPGMTVRERHLIKITLSQGGETLFVPDLTKQPLRNAQTLLQNVGLSIGEVDHRPSLRFEKDQVMATDPPAGAVVGKNALVNLVLSEGPPGSDVLLTPDFVGKSIAQAKSWAAEHDIEVSVREEADNTRSPNEILVQSPEVDAPLRAGQTLTVVVNTGSGGVGSGGPHIRFTVPAGDKDRDVRIVVIDETGEREVYRRGEAPGNKIDLPVTVKGRARARILLNGVVAQEQNLQ